MSVIGSAALLPLTVLTLVMCFTRALTPAELTMHERRSQFCATDRHPSDQSAFMSCEECRTYVKQFAYVIKHETNQRKKYNQAEEACHKFASMFGHNATLNCQNHLESYLQPIEYVIRAEQLPDVCHLIGLCPDEDLTLNGLRNLAELGLAEDIPLKKVKLDRGNSRKDFQFSPWLRTEQNSSNVTFVQISDIHFDPEYREGSLTRCVRVVCCHGILRGEEDDDADLQRGLFAGPFGDYNCDAPERTITAILDFILTLDPQPDFFLYVGDSSVHAVLESMRKKLDDNRRVTSLLVEKLGSLGPIYPAMGNHETMPQSFYYRPTRNAQTVLQSLSEEWPALFDADEEQISTIREHAYYVSEITPSLWILSFNCLYSYSVNIYALLGHLDPVWRKQREFVTETLERARNESAKVIFISHMRPMYQGTWPEYAEYMDSLMAEFNDVIVLQLYGHIHDDSFLVHRDPSNSSRVVGASLSAPSVTPYYEVRAGVNPSIRVFTLERDTWRPLDYTQYYVDLAEANSEGNLKVKLHYQFTEEYNLEDISPASFAALSDRIYTNWTDYQKYESNLQVLATHNRKQCGRDDTRCQRSLTCHTRTAERQAYSACLRGDSLLQHGG